MTSSTLIFSGTTCTKAISLYENGVCVKKAPVIIIHFGRSHWRKKEAGRGKASVRRITNEREGSKDPGATEATPRKKNQKLFPRLQKVSERDQKVFPPPFSFSFSQSGSGYSRGEMSDTDSLFSFPHYIYSTVNFQNIKARSILVKISLTTSSVTT